MIGSALFPYAFTLPGRNGSNRLISEVTREANTWTVTVFNEFGTGSAQSSSLSFAFAQAIRNSKALDQ